VKASQFNALFAENDDEPINSEGYPGVYTPLIGNGYLSHSKGVRSDTYFISGLFNGETTSPSHRARIPATFAVTINNSSTTGTLLDMQEATFYRRGNLTNMGDFYELRWYAHMTHKHLYVMEIEIYFNEDSDTENVIIDFSNNAGRPSDDINFKSEEVVVNGHSIDFKCGETLIPETSTSGSHTVCVASSRIRDPLIVSRKEGGRVFTYITAVYTSLESGSDASDIRNLALQGYEEATKLISQAQLRSQHVMSWASLWESGIEVMGDQRSDVAVAVNASWFAILSSVRDDWPHGLAPGGLTNYYNGHSFWDTEVCTSVFVI
jgi:trehalose/maltose hydrolase-like predicted phosphorylase